MVALGLLERDGDIYRNGEMAATFLTGRTPADLRPFLRFWDKISYPAWIGLAEALGKGPSQEVFDLDDESQQIISAGIEAVLAGPASALPESFDFTPHRRLLDVGGGTGSWTIAVARRYPAPRRRPSSSFPSSSPWPARGSPRPASPRASPWRSATSWAGELPAGHDVFLVANLIHYWSPKDNRALLERVRRAGGASARLLLADFWTNATHTEPLHAALMAGEFAAHLRDGDVYSVDEVREWLAADRLALRRAPPPGRPSEPDRRRSRLRAHATSDCAAMV